MFLRHQALHKKRESGNPPVKRGATGNQAGRGESWKQSSQGWATEEIQAGKKDEEPRWVADPVVHLSNAPNTALSVGSRAKPKRSTCGEFLWRGGDRILLSDDEANGCWAQGVFLSDGPAGDRSITSRVAYWAGGVDPKERGEPVIIWVKGLAELAEGVEKAACVQAMDERGQDGIPMAAPVDPSHLRPLIRGLPDTLKIPVQSLGERIPGTIERNRRAPQNPEHVLTWGEVLHRIVTYGRK